MSTTTTYYAIPKPAVNDPTDEDLWGTEQNSGMDIIDAQLKVATDSIHASLSGNTSIDNTYRNKIVLCDATSAGFTLSLQSAATAGDGFTITFKKIDSTGNAVIVDGNASETIDGSTTSTLSSQYDTLTITCDGTNWQIKSNKTTPTAVADASESVKGILKLATAAMVKTGTDTATAITPAGLASLVTATASGKIVMGGVTVQWGNNPSALSPTVSFGTAFSSSAWVVVATSQDTNTTIVAVTGTTTSNFTTKTYHTGSGSTVACAFYWLAVGPT